MLLLESVPPIDFVMCVGIVPWIHPRLSVRLYNPIEITQGHWVLDSILIDQGLGEVFVRVHSSLLMLAAWPPLIYSCSRTLHHETRRRQ